MSPSFRAPGGRLAVGGSGGRIARRFLAACAAHEQPDGDDIRYYVLLRCFSNCCWVAERRAGMPWRRLGTAPNAWDLAYSIDAFAEHFRAGTGIRLHVGGLRTAAAGRPPGCTVLNA